METSTLYKTRANYNQSFHEQYHGSICIVAAVLSKQCNQTISPKAKQVEFTANAAD